MPDGDIVEVNVFFDTGRSIDINHIRQEVKHINFARTNESANVYLMSTVDRTGGKGFHYSFYFLGMKEFEGLKDTLHYFSSPDKSTTEVRDDYTNVIRMGLIRFLAHGSHVIDVKFNGDNNNRPTVQEDKWDNWIFNIRARTNINGEEAERELDFDVSLDVERITPEWRFEFDFDNNYDEDWYKREDEEIIATRNRRSYESLIVKSIGDHMAIGINSGYSSSSYNNTKTNYWIFPAVEYNLYPYELSSRKQLRFSYYIGYNSRIYNDTTIYNKIEEDLFRQTLSIAYKIKEKWGSAYTSVSAKSYFHNFSKNSLDVRSGVNFRIWKGLSMNVSGDYSIINDRLSILKGDATIEEILLRQRQQSTAYRYQLNVGVSFTFGSLFNNVVNPRLKG